MQEGFRERWRSFVARVRRVERREIREFQAWLENTRNLIHVTILLVVPLILALVTFLANTVPRLSFLLFPPLAAGAYTLFADPEGKYAHPIRFVGGLTTGALCGAFALLISDTLGLTPPAATTPSGLGAVSPAAAGVAVFLTGLATWALDVEVPAAFSTALLAVVVHPSKGTHVPWLPPWFNLPLAYVLSVAAASLIVAGVFLLWREQFYEQRARYLYQSTQGDDHVLVPMRGAHPEATTMLAARLAAAHDAGKVVLFDVIESRHVADVEPDHDGIVATDGGRSTRSAVDDDPADDVDADADLDADEGPPDPDPTAPAEEQAAASAAVDLEAQADHIETKVGVPCEVLVAAEETATAGTVVDAAHRANCDLIVTPYEEQRGALSPFIRDLFRGDVDVLVHRSADGCTRWKRVLVPVRRAGDVAHAMLDFAERLVGATGRVSVAHCIARGGDRRRAESMLADLSETVSATCETRVSQTPIEEFLVTVAPQFDLVIIGASTDRSTASRFVAPPTFERIQQLDCDVAIMDRNFP